MTTVEKGREYMLGDQRVRVVAVAINSSVPSTAYVAYPSTCHDWVDLDLLRPVPEDDTLVSVTYVRGW